MSAKRSTKERLARYIDPQAFAEKVGKERRESMKARRERALKTAAAAIRFFSIERTEQQS